MALRVEQLSLGPMGTNCYVVRASVDAPEAVVVDPSGDATDLRLRLAQLGTRCGAILVTHGHWDHLLGVADLAESAGAPVYMAEGERELLENPEPFTPATIPMRAYSPDVLLSGGESIEVAGIEFDVCVPGHSPAHLAYSADNCLFSGDVLFAGSVGRTDLPRWTGTRSSHRFVRSWKPCPLRRSCIRAMVTPRRSARSSRVIHSWPSCARSALDERRRQDRASSRHARHPPGRATALEPRHRRDRAALLALRLPGDSDAGVRGHCSFRARVR